MLIGIVGWTYTSIQAFDRPIGDQSDEWDPNGQLILKVSKGQSFKSIVEDCEALGIVQHGLLFELYGRYLGVDRLVKAGEYTIQHQQTPRSVLDKLKKGTLPPRVKVTFPEGLNRWEMASRIEEAGLGKADEFLRKVEDRSLEGRLFPDTYWFRRDASVDDVIDRCLSRFTEVFEDVIKQTGTETKYPPGSKNRTELLILASLIEKEGTSADDRKKISRVFYNRIKRGMKLQSDPTCIYDEALYQEAPHPRNCKDPKSKYSTYVIAGLPPTPIANVGRSALEAAIIPFDGPDASTLLYFVARRDGTGGHYFSKTLKEHGAAIDRFLRKKRKRKP